MGLLYSLIVSLNSIQIGSNVMLALEVMLLELDLAGWWSHI